MAHLSLGVLGSLQVSIDDTPVAKLESDKVRALLVYLAVEADGPHRRESLVGLLWPECLEAVARHNLRQALLSLRQAIGDQAARPPYLLISREAIQFNRASDFSLDLDRFSAILQACKQERSRGSEEPSVRAARLEEAVKLYRGEFLQGFFLEDSEEFEQWALVQRESLHQQVLDAHVDLADYYEQHGDFQAAHRHALRQLELDPWREEAHCQAMRALALDGQRTAALTQYETCRRVLAEELGLEPSAVTRQLAEQIRSGTLKTKAESPPSLPAAPFHNLPVSLTSFHGREQELADVGRLLADPECRCVSLVGPGGIGKTRLALQAAERHRAAFPHGVAFVPLASVGTVEAAIAATAGAVRCAFYGPSDPKDQLLNYLSEKQMLLVEDNVEHLLAGGPPQAGLVDLLLDILRRAPGVKLLVTSRDMLDLQEEWVFDVRGLAFPDAEPTGKLDEYPAVALFIQRAKRASPGFAANEADLAAIAQLCCLVEGMPLAIELAATWSRALSPSEIAAEIEGGLDFLSASLRDLPERHRSMRVVFDQTWQRLSAKEQQVLSQLSVFRGGFSRGAAEQVAGASLPVLSALVNRTLGRRNAAGRYELHELVRQYCAGHLAADPLTQAAVQKRHCDYFLSLAEAGGAKRRQVDQKEWLQRLEAEPDNLRAALGWALKQGEIELALRLCGAMGLPWVVHGHVKEGRRWVAEALAYQGPAPLPLRVKALKAAGRMAFEQRDLAAAQAFYEEGLALSQEAGDLSEAASLLNSLGNVAWARDDPGRAGELYDQALTVRRQLNDERGIANVLNDLGLVAMRLRQFERAAQLMEEGISLARSLGDQRALAASLFNLGLVTVRIEGGAARAAVHLAACVELSRELGYRKALAYALDNLAMLALHEGDQAKATSLAQESLELCRGLEDRPGALYALVNLAHAALDRGDPVQAARLLGEALGLLEQAEAAAGLPLREELSSFLEATVHLAISQGQIAEAWKLAGSDAGLRDEVGEQLPPGASAYYEALLSEARTRLDDTDLAAAWAAGQALSPEEARHQALLLIRLSTEPGRSHGQDL
jgi:predicted ATPase/DNA-binding SARP family transcriptional activator